MHLLFYYTVPTLAGKEGYRCYTRYEVVLTLRPSVMS